MTDQNLVLRALKKSYIIIQNHDDTGCLVIHCTLNRKISEKVCGKTFDVSNNKDGFVNAIDLKNDCVVEIDLNKITAITYPGFPFEISPVYILNPNYEGVLSDDDVIQAQAPAFEELNEIRNIQTDKNSENNFIPTDFLSRYSLQYAVHKHYLDKILALEDKNLINTDNIFSKYKNKLKLFSVPDKQNYLNILTELEEFNSTNVSSRVNFFSSPVVKELIVKYNLDLTNIDTTDQIILEKCIYAWKQLIKEYAEKAVITLEQEKQTFIENNKDSTTEVEEIDFVIGIVKNILNDVDFTKFKTPFEVFCFWPPVLYPAPFFVIDPYRLD